MRSGVGGCAAARGNASVPCSTSLWQYMWRTPTRATSRVRAIATGAKCAQHTHLLNAKRCGWVRCCAGECKRALLDFTMAIHVEDSNASNVAGARHRHGCEMCPTHALIECEAVWVGALLRGGMQACLARLHYGNTCGGLQREQRRGCAPSPRVRNVPNTRTY